MVGAPISPNHKIANEQMWKYLDKTCGADFVCPITLMLTVEARNNSPWRFKGNIVNFLRNHPEAETLYNESASMPCQWAYCDTVFCDPGVLYRCDKCRLPYCRAECRSAAMGYHMYKQCMPGMELPLELSIQENEDHPRSYIEHMLGVFGIDLSPRKEADISLDVDIQELLFEARTSHGTGVVYDELLAKADEMYTQGYYIRAFRLYSVALYKLEERDKRSNNLAVVYYKRAK